MMFILVCPQYGFSHIYPWQGWHREWGSNPYKEGQSLLSYLWTIAGNKKSRGVNLDSWLLNLGMKKALCIAA